MLEVKLPNGATLKGEYEVLKPMLNVLGIELENGEYYLSSKQGLLRIRDMETTHLKNATLKRYREYLETIKTLPPKQLAARLYSMPIDKTLTTMIYTLGQRDI